MGSFTWEVCPRADTSEQWHAAVHLNTVRLTAQAQTEIEAAISPHVERLGGTDVSVSKTLVLMSMADGAVCAHALNASRTIRSIIKERIAELTEAGVDVYDTEPIELGVTHSHTGLDYRR